MGFMQKFLAEAEGVRRGQRTTSSFDCITREELETHMGIRRYQKFTLSDAVRPAYDLKVRPSEGYRHDTYRDEETGRSMPVLMIAASKEKLFDLFLDLLTPLGSVVDVVLETSHTGHDAEDELLREAIDLPILKSVLCDHEDMLVDDGCTGIAVINNQTPQEIQFDEHKLLIVYGEPLAAFEAILEEHGLRCDESLRFITEAEHIHCTSEPFSEEFENLKSRLGIDGAFMMS